MHNVLNFKIFLEQSYSSIYNCDGCNLRKENVDVNEAVFLLPNKGD
jgi:hypothetical protein